MNAEREFQQKWKFLLTINLKRFVASFVILFRFILLLLLLLLLFFIQLFLFFLLVSNHSVL